MVGVAQRLDLPAGRQGISYDKMYFVYILRSQKDSEFYTGITNDIERRLQAHNKGEHATPSTLKRGPFELIHVEIVSDRKKARKLEKYFKSGAGREIRDELVDSWWH